jgi:hypothetical protein
MIDNSNVGRLDLGVQSRRGICYFHYQRPSYLWQLVWRAVSAHYVTIADVQAFTDRNAVRTKARRSHTKPGTAPCPDRLGRHSDGLSSSHLKHLPIHSYWHLPATRGFVVAASVNRKL